MPTKGANSFEDSVEKIFGFLVSDFGARVLGGESHRNPSMFSSVQFGFENLVLSVYWERGQIGIGFWVKTDTAILQPYISHHFELWQIANYLEPDFWEKRARREFPIPPEDYESELVVQRDALLRFCQPILRGDFDILEQVAIARG